MGAWRRDGDPPEPASVGGLSRDDTDRLPVAQREATTRRATSFHEHHGFVDSAILNSEDRLPDYWATTHPKRRQY